jgi:hypothetical protein
MAAFNTASPGQTSRHISYAKKTLFLSLCQNPVYLKKNSGKRPEKILNCQRKADLKNPWKGNSHVQPAPPAAEKQGVRPKKNTPDKP